MSISFIITPVDFSRCIRCCCKACDKMREYVRAVADKKEETKINEVSTTSEVNVNLCEGEGFLVKEEFLINYTDLRHKVMVLDIGTLVSLTGA